MASAHACRLAAAERSSRPGAARDAHASAPSGARPSPAVETIRSSREIDHLFRTGRKFSDPLLVFIVSPSSAERPGGRVCFVAGRRIGSAVTRNRSRRVLREAARRAGAPWTGADVALVARPETARATVAQLDSALAAVLRRSDLQ